MQDSQVKVDRDLGPVREYFRRNVDEWAADRYEDETYRGRGERALAWLREAGDGLLVLDVGCGGGRQSAAAAAAGHRVTSADFAPEMIQHARTRVRERVPSAEHAGVVADARQLPFAAGAFDAIMVLGVVGYLPDLDGFLAQAARLLRPGGRLICDVGVPQPRVLLHAVSRGISAPVAAVDDLRRAVLRLPPADRTDPPGFYTRTFTKYAPAEFEAALIGAGFEVKRRAGAGWGDLRILRKHVLPWRVHKGITRLLNRASRRSAWLAGRALIYVVAADRKP